MSIDIQFTRQGECLLISSLPGKALKTLVELRGLPSDSACVLEFKACKTIQHAFSKPRHAE